MRADVPEAGHISWQTSERGNKGRALPHRQCLEDSTMFRQRQGGSDSSFARSVAADPPRFSTPPIRFLLSNDENIRSVEHAHPLAGAAFIIEFDR